MPSGFVMPNVLPQAPSVNPAIPLQPVPPLVSKWTKMGPAEQAKFEATIAEAERKTRPLMGINMDTGELTYQVPPNDDIPDDDNER